MKRDLSYLIKDDGAFEVVKNKNRPFVLFTENGIEYYDYAILGTDIQKMEYLDDGSVDLLHSILVDIKGFQDTNDEVIIKQRFLTDSLKYYITRMSPNEIQIVIDPGIFHRKKVYSLKVNGSELLFTNKKGEGTHLTIKNDSILIQRTVDAFIGNKIRESQVSIDY